MLEQKLQEKGNNTTCPIAVIVSGEKVLVGLRHYTPDKWKAVSVWTCPGGRCDPDETLEETLRREVAEETGINDLQFLQYCGDFPGAKENDTVPVFLCTTKQEPQLLEPHKFSEWRWEESRNLSKDTFINVHVLELIKTEV